MRQHPLDKEQYFSTWRNNSKFIFPACLPLAFTTLHQSRLHWYHCVAQFMSHTCLSTYSHNNGSYYLSNYQWTYNIRPINNYWVITHTWLSWLTCLMAVTLFPVLMWHIIIFSSNITWKLVNSGLSSIAVKKIGCKMWESWTLTFPWWSNIYGTVGSCYIIWKKI